MLSKNNSYRIYSKPLFIVEKVLNSNFCETFQRLNCHQANVLVLFVLHLKSTLILLFFFLISKNMSKI